MPITNYQIVTATTPDDLARKVLDAIGDSWQPFGSMVRQAGGDNLCQPMTQGDDGSSPAGDVAAFFTVKSGRLCVHRSMLSATPTQDGELYDLGDSGTMGINHE